MVTKDLDIITQTHDVSFAVCLLLRCLAIRCAETDRRDLPNRGPAVDLIAATLMLRAVLVAKA